MIDEKFFEKLKNDKIAIHCKTEEQANKLIFLEPEDSYTCWDEYKDKTCYPYGADYAEFCSLDDFETEEELAEFTIWTFEKFIEEYNKYIDNNQQQSNKNIENKISIKEEKKNMTNLNELVKTGVNGETLVKGKNDGYYKILENGTLGRELYVFENIAPIQIRNTQTLEKNDIIIHENGLWYVTSKNDTTIKITSYETLTSVEMAVLQADGLDSGFEKVVNPITYQIKQLNVKARDLLATNSANVPKLQVAVEFSNSDNMEKMANIMTQFVEAMSKK